MLAALSKQQALYISTIDTYMCNALHMLLALQCFASDKAERHALHVRLMHVVHVKCGSDVLFELRSSGNAATALC